MDLEMLFEISLALYNFLQSRQEARNCTVEEIVR